MKTVAFVMPCAASFVRCDLEILSRHFNVQLVDFSPQGSSSFAAKCVRAVSQIHHLVVAVAKCDLTFVWFASYPAFLSMVLSRLFWKPCVVIPAGYSVANVPEINYGLLTNRFLAPFVRYILRHAALLLADSEANLEETRLACPSARVELIYHGIDIGRHSRKPDSRKDDIVLTVGGISPANLQRKGHEAFARASVLLPDTRFILAGRTYGPSAVDRVEAMAGPNLEIVHSPTDAELLVLYSRAKVYVQASRHEAFGLSLAEAMCAECVPVTSRYGSLPEVAGDTAYYVDPGEPADVADAIRTALVDADDRGIAAGRRIRELFDVKTREKKLVAALQGLMPTGKSKR